MEHTEGHPLQLGEPGEAALRETRAVPSIRRGPNRGAPRAEYNVRGWQEVEGADLWHSTDAAKSGTRIFMIEAGEFRNALELRAGAKPRNSWPCAFQRSKGANTQSPSR